MKNLKHTPGPWKYEPGEEELGYKIRHFVAWGGTECDQTTVCETNYGEHDARLIAAAPEMLEALIYLLRVADPYRTGGMQHQRDAISMSIAAIEKATGMKIEEALK